MKKSFYFFLAFSIAAANCFAESSSEEEKNRAKFTAIVKEYEEEIKHDPNNLSLILAVAEVYSSLKKFPKAIEYYKRALALKPNSNKIKLELALAYLNNNDLTHSQTLFQQVVQEEPQNINALSGLGRVEALKHNFNEAENYYTQVLKSNPNHSTTQFYYAELKINQKKFLEAEKMLNELIGKDPNASWLKIALKKAKFGPVLTKIADLREKGDFPAIFDLLNKQLEEDPNNLEVYLALARAYTDNKQYSKAQEILQKGLTIFPKENALFVAEGFTYLAENDLDHAEYLFTSVIETGGPQAEAEAGLGRVAYLQGNLQKAEEYYKNAIELSQYSTLGLSYLAQLRMEQKRYDEAVELYERVLQMDEQAEWVRLGIAEAKIAPTLDLINKAVKENDFDKAENLYKDLLDQFPESSNNYLRFAKFYRSQKRYPEALKISERGILNDSQSIPLQISLGFDYLLNKNFDQSLNEFQDVLDRDTNNADALAGMGRIKELNNDADSAINYYQEALKSDPKNVSALIFLANLKMDLGDYNTAQELYQRLAQVQPSAKWIKFAIQDAKHGPLLKEISDNIKAKNFIAAEALWLQLINEESTNSDYYLRFGLFYHGIKNYEKAIAIYSKGIEIDSSSSELLASLGLVYLSTKDYGKAESAFQQALKINPLNPDALAGLGNVLMVREKYAEAEKLMKTALRINPESVAALSSYGDLMMKMHRYPEASNAYEKLLALRPEEKWIRLSLDDAVYGEEIDQIKELIAADNFSEAAELYRALLEKSPDNPRFYFGLGQMYMRLKKYGLSIETNKIGLEKNPEENELRVALGYAYFFNRKLSKAREVLNEALAIDGKDPEGLAGIGRVDALENYPAEAEEYYRKALAIDPKNLSAMTFYANLLMRERRFDEAQEVYAGIRQILPNADWVQMALQDARDGEATHAANVMSDQEEFECAKVLYRELLEASPRDPVRYLPLGQMYVDLQEYCCGLDIFYQGLEIDPEAPYLWRAIAYTHILREEYCEAQEIYESLLDADPEDAFSWAGLGRIQALDGSNCLAADYYITALEIDPGNFDGLSYLADLQQNEMYNISALETYEDILQVVETNNEWAWDPMPKWVRRGYNNARNLALPTLNLAGAYHEEDQWDPTVHRWSAKYQVYGGKALVNFPVTDKLTIWESGEDQYFVLKDLLTHKNIYSFDVQRCHLGARWTYNPCFFVDVKAGISHYSPFQSSTFKLKTGTYFEPSITCTYHTPIDKATLGFFTTSDLIARNFNTNRAKLVEYYTLAGAYERKIMQRGWAGLEAAGIWYNDYVHNNSHRISGWFQWRPPCWSDNILFRYYTKYQTFARNIPDYYTYKPQFINQLQATLEKSWRVCWADTFYTSLSYGHGWQNTRTRFSQIIVIAPTPIKQPFIWDNRQFDIVIGTLIYKYDQIQVKFAADYYRDTKKYTIWNAGLDLTWRF